MRLKLAPPAGAATDPDSERHSRLLIGQRATCKIIIVDCDDWPSTESVQKGEDYIFWE